MIHERCTELIRFRFGALIAVLCKTGSAPSIGTSPFWQLIRWSCSIAEIKLLRTKEVYCTTVVRSRRATDSRYQAKGV